MKEAPGTDRLKDDETVAGMDRTAVARVVSDLDERPLDAFPLFMQDLPQPDLVAANVPLQALQSLLYEGTPADQALNFKNQGNECFLLGPPGYKDALCFYTRGLQCQSGDAALEATLHLNRAAVHLGLGHWAEALRDSQQALQWDVQTVTAQVKAHRRIIRAALRLGLIDETRSSVETLRVLGYPVDDGVLEELAGLERRQAAEMERRQRVEAALEQIRRTIGPCRGITVEAGAESALLEHFGSQEGLSDRLPSVRRDPKTKRRLWPVLLLYPAAAQSDLLDQVDEGCQLGDLLATVFGETLPSWDERGAYRNVATLQIFWHDHGQCERIVQLKQSTTLGDLLGTLITRIERGILAFYVVPHGAPTHELLQRFSIRECF